jgi:hypothetical protein
MQRNFLQLTTNGTTATSASAGSAPTGERLRSASTLPAMLAENKERRERKRQNGNIQYLSRRLSGVWKTT